MSESVYTVSRGNLAENIIRADIAVCDSEGNLIKSVGDPQKVCYMRSCAKPIQALAVIESGAQSRFHFDNKELAIFCASHNAEPQQLQAVESVLRKLGLKEDNLLCGKAVPYAGRQKEIYKAGDFAPRALVNNCSGKHAGLLASCIANKWRITDYFLPSHPVQKLVLDIIADFCAIPKKQIICGVDGCGVPVFAMPLANMAKGYAELLQPTRVKASRREAAAQICIALRKNPLFIAGTGEFDSLVNFHTNGKIIAKRGADGVFLAACADGPAVALKMESGSNYYAPFVMFEALRQLGCLTKIQQNNLIAWSEKNNLNCRGEVVGTAKAEFVLRKAASDV